MFQSSEGFGAGAAAPMFEPAIAIVGLSCRFAGARTPDEYWANLRAGVNAIKRFSDESLAEAGVSPALMADPAYVKAGAPLADMECFDATLFGLSPRDARIMDPQHRHFLECAREALENAGHVPERFAGAIGIFGGSGHNAYLASNLLTNPKLVRDVGLFLLRHTGNDKDFLTTRVSYLLDLKGPSVNVQTACSTSLVAVHMAIQSLLGGECDMALAGGASIELPHRHGYLHEEGGILSPDGLCRPFDDGAGGTVFGSGVGMVVLRRLKDAVADGDNIYAVIRGSAVNNDGSAKVGYLAPSVDGQAQVITEALNIAEVDARTIGYVEAHGTGTPVGDPIEVAALTQAFRQDTDDVGFCGLGSVKANIGHTDTAAGAASLIKVALALHHGELPPSLNFETPNSACDLPTTPFFVNAALKPWTRRNGQPLRAGVTSLGVGGTNAHVVLEEAPRTAKAGPSRSHQLLVTSAASPSALDANAAALAAHLAAHPGLDLADAAYTLDIGRQALPHRRITVARDGDEAAQALGGAAPERVFTGQALADRPVAFLFGGAGAQHAGMADGLYRSEAIFRDVVDACMAHLIEAGGVDLSRWLFPVPVDMEAAAREMERPSIALPLLFTIQVATARLWMSWGVRPTGMIGHSAGEYAAAHIAGVFGLDDALRVVGARGRLLESLEPGSMLSVPLSEDALRPMLDPELSIAAVNGARSCVASGPADAISRLQETLGSREVESQPVRIAVAAHSAMVDPVLTGFRALLETLTLASPTLPFVSSLTGDWIAPAEATSTDYWVRHFRETVRFSDGLARLLGDETRVLLEVGPGRAMASLARQHAGRSASQPVLTSLRHPDDPVADVAHLLTTLGRLWALGAPVNWGRFWIDEQRRRVPLPTYRYDRQHHWVEPGSTAPRADVTDADDGPLTRSADIADWFYEPVWHRAQLPRPRTVDGAALVFGDATGLGDTLAARLRAAGRQVTTVRAGRGFRRHAADAFTIDPREAGHYRRLVEQLGGLPAEIYHCWLVTGTENVDDPDARRAAAMQDRGLYSLLFLAQTLAEADVPAPIQVAVVSDHMQRVCGDEPLAPAKATALGACAVIARETPDLRMRSIDIDRLPRDARGRQRLADALIAELASPDDNHVVGYRAFERWTQSYDPAARSEPASSAALTAQLRRSGSQVRQGGVYVITGGLGGLGLCLARHLATSHGARVALISRTPLPPRETWSERLASTGADDPVHGIIREILSMEAAGGEILPIAADVCDARAMRRAMRLVRKRLGAVNGAFHAAGVLDDGPMQLKSRAEARRVIAPKLFGTLALDAALASERPDFIVLFSSISAFAGLPGQVDYAAANAFLDAYAQARHADGPMRVVSVAWSQWQEVGMAAALARTSGADSCPDVLDTGTRIDHPFLDTLHVVSAEERVVAARLSPDTHWLLDEHRLADGSALIPGTGFVEIARAAFAQIEPGPAELSNLDFLAPFAVPNGTSRELRVYLRRRGEQGWRFSIFGRACDAPENAWTEHARGLAAASRGGPAGRIPLDAIRNACAAGHLDPRSVENPSHLRFGPRWRNVRNIAVDARAAVIDLELPHEFRDDLGIIALHPALLDLATAGAQALIPDHDRQRDFFAPVAYGSVRIHAALPATISSHVRYRSDAGGSSALALFDVTLTDPAGTVLVEIADFTMVAIADPATLAFTDTARARATRAPPAAAISSLPAGLLPEEGLRVLDRILGSDAASHVIVSPHDLRHAIARMHGTRRDKAGVSVDAGDESDDAGPMSAAERMIAGLWSEMLGVERVRRTDDFFELGGHSLLAIQFTNRVRKQTGKTLPLSALLESPTVERLAAIIDPDGVVSAAASPLTAAAGIVSSARTGPNIVTLRPGGGDPPLFFVHDGLGETLLYRGLALRLDPARAIYGIDPGRGADGAFLHTRIDEMAAAYITRIRGVRPHGPYLLAGLCAGGVIAFEMARQLEDAGEAVPFVGIIDAADVEASKRRGLATRARIARVRGLFDRTSGDGTTATLSGAIAAVLGKAANAAAWEITSRLDRRRRARLLGTPQGTGDEQAVASPPPPISFLQMYEIAHLAHRPSGLFASGQVVLFRASASSDLADDTPYVEVYADGILGWGKRVDGDVVAIDVPGGHMSTLREPHVATTAARFQRAVDAACVRIAGHPDTPEDRAEPDPTSALVDTEARIKVPAEMMSR